MAQRRNLPAVIPRVSGAYLALGREAPGEPLDQPTQADERQRCAQMQQQHSLVSLTLSSSDGSIGSGVKYRCGTERSQGLLITCLSFFSGSFNERRVVGYGSPPLPVLSHGNGLQQYQGRAEHDEHDTSCAAFAGFEYEHQAQPDADDGRNYDDKDSDRADHRDFFPQDQCCPVGKNDKSK